MDQKWVFTRQSQPDEHFRGKPWDDKLNSKAITQRNCFEDETSPVLTYVSLCSLFLHVAKVSEPCSPHWCDSLLHFFQFISQNTVLATSENPGADQQTIFLVGLIKETQVSQNLSHFFSPIQILRALLKSIPQKRSIIQ